MIDQFELINIISKSLNLSKDKIDISVSSESLEERDSLGHLTILSAIDKATDGKASEIETLSSCSSVKEIFENLKKNNLAK